MTDPWTLTEARAWEIAIAAGEALRGCVRLTLSGVGKREIIGRYDWIEIAVPVPDELPEPGLQHTLAWVAKAREACAVWHLLACCPGYRGHENDVFWKRVVDVVAKKPEMPATTTEVETLMREMFEMFQDEVVGPNVNDGYRFFSGDSSLTFPRFRVNVPLSVKFDEPPDPGVARRFWRTQGATLRMPIYRRPVKEERNGLENGSFQDGGIGDLEDRKEDEGEHTEIQSASDWFVAVVRAFAQANMRSQNPLMVEFVKELLPYVDAKSYCEKPVDIGVLMDNFYPLKHMARAIRGIISDWKAQNTTVEEGTCLDRLRSGILCFPQCVLSEFAIPYSDPFQNHKELQWLTEIIETCDVTIPEVQFEPSTMVDDSTMARFVRSLCGGRPNCSAMVQSLTLEAGKATPRQLEMLFSAMPIATVNQLTLTNARRNLGRRGWTWLAYALFHPWTRQSRWREVDLQDADVSEPVAIPLRSTSAAQATLFSLLHGEDDDTATEIDSDMSCGRYSVVDVQGGTACFASNSLLGMRLCSFKSQCRVTAVIKNSVDKVDDLDDVVCVIVPGCGHGWVAKYSIHAVTHLPSAGASIRGLKLGPAFADPTMELQALGPLLRCVDSLDIFAWGTLNSTQMLEIMRMCADLTQLTAQHRGDVFSTWTVETSSTDKRLQACRLKDVNLVCYQEFGSLQTPSQAAWRTCLSEVSSVLVQTFGAREFFEKSVCQFLHEGHAIERFVWDNCSGERPTEQQFSYDAKRIRTRELLGIANGTTHEKAQQRMSIRARAAFASVINHNTHVNLERSRAIGRLSHDVAKWICDFSTTDVERFVWVESR